MLPRVVELRQAHWLWLPDLQPPDPWHILPILMVVSQFLVQFYTPSPGVDPQQQKMMAFMMPAVSGYFTWTLRLRPRSLLGGRQPHQHRPAGRHEPHQHSAARCARSPPNAPAAKQAPVPTIKGKR